MKHKAKCIETYRAYAVFLLGLLLLPKNSASGTVQIKNPTDLRADSVLQKAEVISLDSSIETRFHTHAEE